MPACFVCFLLSTKFPYTTTINGGLGNTSSIKQKWKKKKGKELRDLSYIEIYIYNRDFTEMNQEFVKRVSVFT